MRLQSSALGRAVLSKLELLRNLLISDFLAGEVNDANMLTVFYLAFAKIVQVRLPMIVLLKILGGMFRDQDVSGISTVHYPLRDIDSGAGNV